MGAAPFFRIFESKKLYDQGLNRLPMILLLRERSDMSIRILGSAAAVLVLAFHVAGRGGDADPAKEIVAKAIKAAGGDAKLAPLKIGICKAKANIQDGNQQIAATIDATWQGWDQYRFTVAADFGGMAKNILVVINGDKGWAKDADRNETKEAPKDDLPMITSMLAALRMPHRLPALLDKEIKLSPLGEIKIGDRAAVGVSVAYKGDTSVSLFFDKENHLPAKSEIRLTDSRGREKTFEFNYHDYKETTGFKHPTKILLKVENVDVTLEVSELKTVEKLDAGTFAAPD